MKKVTVLLCGCMLSPLSPTWAQSSGGHGDHGRGGGGGTACQKLRLNKDRLIPVPLSEVPPGSEISFLAFGIDNPNHLEVFVKKIPVPITTEFKDTFYRVTGKLPEQLKDTPARIDIKFRAKNPKCNSEEGWLIKITE